MAGAPPPDDPSHLPVDPITGRPLPPRAQPGYYPGYSTLSQSAFWDEATRAVVLRRMQPPPICFFTQDEARTMAAVCETLLPQADRDAEHRIPITNYIDERLCSGRRDGYRFADMPDDAEAFRLGLQGIDAVAVAMHGRGFAQLDWQQREQVMKTLHDGRPPAGNDVWRRMPVHRFWLLLFQDILAAYYAHPWAWDEIGYGGPAYPRGYMRLEHGEPEPWEAAERRYAWQPPPGTLSQGFEPVAASYEHHARPGQGGTH